MRRPPPLLWLLLLLLLLLPPLGAAAAPADAPSQLPAPGNPKIRLYNAQQVLSWEPVSLDGDARPVVYHVQFKYPDSSQWSELNVGVNCSKLAVPECDLSEGFPPHHNISLRVRAELQDRASSWAVASWFQHHRNVTVGPPKNISVTSRGGRLVIKLSPPFDLGVHSKDTFLYYVRYWEKPGNKQQVQGPFQKTSIELAGLRPLQEYCVQVEAHLQCRELSVGTAGRASDVVCRETTANASVKLQQVVLIAVATFLSLTGLAGACLVLILRYRRLVKHWFCTPPGVPAQLGEYLKEPTQPILEVLGDNCAPKDDAWVSVSVLSSPEEEEEEKEEGETPPAPEHSEPELGRC